MQKQIYYFYFRLYHFFKNISDDFLNNWKPLIIIDLLQIFIFFQVLNWYTIISGDVISFSNTSNLVLVLVAFLSGFNYYLFLHNDKWKKYNQEFSSYNQRKKAIGSFIVFFIVFLITAGMILSFYKLSQEDFRNK